MEVSFSAYGEHGRNKTSLGQRYNVSGILPALSVVVITFIQYPTTRDMSLKNVFLLNEREMSRAMTHDMAVTNCSLLRNQ